MPPSPATPAGSAAPDREEALAAAAATDLDVLVVGGGITGAGVALDAAARGYRVALVERDDLSSGTSSKSSKLVHGGVRYLANADVAMVAEGVRERDRLRRLAPHLVRPLGFVVPLPDLATRAQLKAGLALYDAIALGRNRTHRYLRPGEVLRDVPGLVTGFEQGGYRYDDCQTDDSRLTLQVAQVARRLGALVVNHAEVLGLHTTGERVVGAEVRDRLTGEAHTLRARWTVSASGVWAATLRGLAPTPGGPELTPSKGVHLTFDGHHLPVNRAVVVPSGLDDGRMLFVIPWGGQAYVGTTDDVYDGDRDRPDLDEADAAYLCGAVNRAFGTDLTPADAVGAWAGLRPLASGAAGATKDLSRRHVVLHDPPGLVTVTGGKLTTYRQMAEDTVDLLAAADGRAGASPTARIPLGAGGRAEDGVVRVRELAARHGLDARAAGGLYHRHGDLAPTVLRFCLEHDGTAPLVPGLPWLAGEVRWAVRHELARTVDDVLQRRTRVSLRHAGAGGAAVERVADVVAEELGLDAAERAAQVEAYLDAVAHERGPVPLDLAWRGPAARAS
ncbi:MAG: FAD-dependent oxidoreductase [Actinomycetes bacterium]